MNGARTLLAFVALAICVLIVVGCKNKGDEPVVAEPVVAEPIVAEPGISPRIIIVSIGDSFTLSGANVPSGATWLSKDDSTAFVGPSGRVVALAAGAVQIQVVKEEEVLVTGYAVITGADTGVNYLDTLEHDETGRPSQRTREFVGPSPTGVITEIETYQWSPSGEFLVANENTMLLQDETRKTWKTEDKRDEAGRLESRHIEHLLGDKVTERSWDNYTYDDKGRITAIHGEGTLGKDGKPAKWWKEWEYDDQ